MSDQNDETKRATPHTLHVGRADGEQIDVLLIEDNPSDEALVRLLLNKSETEFVVRSVPRLADAISHVREHNVDVVLLDLGLPDSTGLQALDAILGTGRDLEVVVLTGLDDDGLATEALHIGAIDYLVKGGFGSYELMRALRYASAKKTSHAAQARIAQADRLTALGQLTSRIAHEINNPATYVSANIEISRDDVDALEELVRSKNADPEALAERFQCIREALEDAASGVVRIRRLASEVTSFSRFGSVPVVAISLQEVLENAVQQTSVYVAERAELTASIDDGGIIVDGDAFRLEQVFTNLIRNAADACEVGPAREQRIVVTVDKEGDDWMVVHVEDSGVGIPEDVLPHIFEPFYTSKSRGTGLGLSLVIEIVRAHQGYVEVTSSPGKGTRVSVFIPRSGANVPRPADRWIH